MTDVESFANLIFIREVPLDMPDDTPEFKGSVTGLARALVFGVPGRLLINARGGRIAAFTQPLPVGGKLPPDVPGVELQIPIPAGEGRVTPLRFAVRNLQEVRWESPGIVFESLADHKWGVAPPVARLVRPTAVPPHRVFESARQQMIHAFVEHVLVAPTLDGIVRATAAIGTAGIDGAFFAMGLHEGPRPKIIVAG